jgi:hypothetical protein
VFRRLLFAFYSVSVGLDNDFCTVEAQFFTGCIVRIVFAIA